MAKRRWQIPKVLVGCVVLAGLMSFAVGRAENRRLRGLPDPHIGQSVGQAPMSLSEAPKLVWRPVMTGGFGNPVNALIRGLEVFDGRLLAITSGGGGGKVFRLTTLDPATWEKVVDLGFVQFGNSFIPRFRLIRAFTERLYIGTAGRDRGVKGAQIWRTNDGTVWKNVFDSELDDSGVNFSVRSMESFRDYLYAGMGTEFLGPAKIYRSLTGQEWELVMGDGFGKPRGNQSVYALGSFQDELYAGTFNLRGAEVYRSRDGVTWELVSRRGFRDPRNIYIYELRVYQPTATSTPRLIAITGPNPAGGEVWSYDGSSWSQMAPNGFGTARNTDMWQANQFGRDFYVGTFKFNSEEASEPGAELWRFDYDQQSWIPETLDGFGNPDNTGFRVIFPWNGALYVGTLNKVSGGELWVGTPQ